MRRWARAGAPSQRSARSGSLMVIVDTSVWSLALRLDQPVFMVNRNFAPCPNVLGVHLHAIVA